MPILVACPNCGGKLTAPDSAAGKRVRCPRPGCEGIADVPLYVEAAPSPPPAPPPPARRPVRAEADDEDDDRPRRRRRDNDDEDDDDRPRGRSRGRRRDDDDEDDRPRRRPRPRRKSSGGAGKIVAIVLVGLVVLGGVGFGVYALLGKTRPPEGWKEFTYKEDGFKAYFPKEPRVEGGGGVMGRLDNVDSSRAYLVMDEPRGNRRIVGVFVFKFRSGTPAAEQERAIESFREELKNSDTKVSDTRSVSWAGQKAKEVTVEEKGGRFGGKGGKIFLRYMTVNNVGYVGIIGMDTGGELTSRERNGFFDNFELLK